MKKKIFNKLNIRFSIGIFLILAIPAGTAIAIIGNNLKNDFRQITLNEFAYGLELKAEKTLSILNFAKGGIEAAVNVIEGDILIHPGIEEIDFAKGVQAVSFYQSALGMDLVSDLRKNINSNEFYVELRIILPNGQELIRFNRTGAGVAQVPVSELQNKADRGYFRYFTEAPGNEAHVSPIFLNEEYGKVTFPPIPMIRLGKRIYMNDGRLFGILVLNINSDLVFGRTTSEEKPGFLIIDEEGVYLRHWDKKMLFGKELGHGANLLTESPVLKLNLQKQDSRIHYDPELREFRVWRKVFFDKSMASKNYWVFMERHSEASISSTWYNSVRNGLAWLSAILGISLLLSALFTHKILLPLKAFEDAMAKMGKGDLDARIAFQDSTELGKIANAFNKMAEDLLEKTVSKNYVDKIIECMTNALFIISSEISIKSTNQAACDLLGYQEEELIGQPASLIFARKELFKGMGLEELFKKGFLKNTEKDLLSKDGRRIPVLFSASLLRENDSTIQGVVCVAQDITERKKAEEELSRLAMAVKQTGDTIVITDADGTIQYVNPAFERISGYSAEEATGQNPRIFKNGQTDGAVYRKMWETITGGKIWKGHFTNRKKDGTIYQEEANIAPIFDGSGKIINYVAVKRDVTGEIRQMATIEKQMRELKGYSDVLLSILEDSNEIHQQLKSAISELKSKQAQLVQSSKLASIGELTAGVAHELNQPIMVIRGFTQMMLRDKEKYDEKTQRNLLIIEKSTARMTVTIDHLRTFSRKSAGSHKALDLRSPLEEAFAFVSDLLKSSNITVEKDYNPDLPLIKGDNHQLEQVLLNLISNSRHALDEYEIKLGKGQAGWKKLISAKTGYNRETGMVWLEFSDTGGGIPEEYLDKIFDPFFTSKEVGKGTGLGLSVSYGIIKEHKGDIEASNSKDGAVFRITLPAVNSDK